MLWNSDLSLFSPQALSERENRGLLIQFLLSELIEAYKSVQSGKLDAVVTPHPRFFPYDWSAKTGYLNKILEHALLLQKSFPDRARAVKNCERTLSKTLASFSKKKKLDKEQMHSTLQTVYSSLEPLIEACKENENLLFFLLKNRTALDALTRKGHLQEFLGKIHPCGLEILGEKMCDQYHQRGFFSQIPEFKLLLTELSHV
ncbi:MAG: hypothetical protein JSS60_06200 [Verrucomicrobia bacterium]|nr:hypothetical protein [Verrucomicrobiota bacterium]